VYQGAAGTALCGISTMREPGRIVDIPVEIAGTANR
jgi:hypothetical protein